MAASASDPFDAIQQAETCLLLNRPTEGLKHIQTLTQTALSSPEQQLQFPTDLLISLACLHIQLQSRLSPGAEQLRASMSVFFRELSQWPLAVWLTMFSALVDSGADEDARALAHEYLLAASANLDQASQAVVLRAEATRILFSGGEVSDVKKWLNTAHAHPDARAHVLRDYDETKSTDTDAEPTSAKASSSSSSSSLPLSSAAAADGGAKPKTASSSSPAPAKPSALTGPNPRLPNPALKRQKPPAGNAPRGSQRTRQLTAQVLAFALWLLGVAGLAKWLVRQPGWNNRMASLVAFFGANSVRTYLS